MASGPGPSRELRSARASDTAPRSSLVAASVLPDEMLTSAHAWYTPLNGPVLVPSVPVLMTTSGGSLRRIARSLITTSRTPRWLGMSNMTSNMAPSRMLRSPRAPVFRLMASDAMVFRASSVKRSCTPSSSIMRLYCRVSAFLGWVRIVISAFSSR